MKRHGSILDEIVAHKRREVEECMAAVPLDALQRKVESAPAPRDFVGALRRNPGERVRVLAEIKAASPSHGVICQTVDPGPMAQAYQAGGASALSVLTDQRYFAGSDSHLIEARGATNLPTLRKDFTLHEYQIWEARSIGADAILLMAQILEQEEIDQFLDCTRRLGMVALVEGHDAEEIDTILRTEALLVGINNRDFRTMKTDIATTLRLRDRIPRDRVLVSQSGISQPAQVRQLSRAGVDAIQVGTALMAGGDLARNLALLLEGAHEYSTSSG